MKIAVTSQNFRVERVSATAWRGGISRFTPPRRQTRPRPCACFWRGVFRRRCPRTTTPMERSRSVWAVERCWAQDPFDEFADALEQVKAALVGEKSGVVSVVDVEANFKAKTP